MDTNDSHSSKRREFMTTAAGALLGVTVTGGAGVGSATADPESEDVSAVVYEGQDDSFGPEPTPLPGSLFDTGSSRVTGNGRVAHNELPFGDGKPYVLKHEGGGRFTQRGATINFEGPDDLWPTPGRWRAVVREDVQAARDGSFAWSVTRVDFFARPRMEYAQSMVIVVWDDGVVDYPNDDVDTVVERLQQAGAANPGGK